jgi:hypothetical protein
MAEVFVFVAWSFLHCSLAPRNTVVCVTEAKVVCEHVNIIIIYTYLFLALQWHVMPPIVRVRYQAQCAQNDDVMPGRKKTPNQNRSK